MSRRRRGGNSRTRRISNNEQAKAAKEAQAFWHGSADLPEPSGRIRVTEDPAAVIRSLGPAPLGGRETIAEHYFEAVYQRAVTISSALAAAGDLIDDGQDDD
ncbi:MAG: hypothetical protein P8N02_08035 [Actinomycetota bacterium]|jgi:hypothetical protein|nr:hypothetical protein [Actinomycetota bacterium]